MTEMYVKVTPGTGYFQVQSGKIPEIELEHGAENGKANAELRNRLEEITGQKAGIVSGHRSRRKKIVLDLPEEKIRQKLRDYNG